MLTIGAHELTGKVEKLPKPCAILRRRDDAVATHFPSPKRPAREGEPEAAALEYEVCGLVT